MGGAHVSIHDEDRSLLRPSPRMESRGREFLEWRSRAGLFLIPSEKGDLCGITGHLVGPDLKSHVPARLIVVRCCLSALRRLMSARSKTPRRWQNGCCDADLFGATSSAPVVGLKRDAVSLPEMRKRRHHRSASPRDHADRESKREGFRQLSRQFGVSETTESAARARENASKQRD